MVGAGAGYGGEKRGHGYNKTKIKECVEYGPERIREYVGAMSITRDSIGCIFVQRMLDKTSIENEWGGGWDGGCINLYK